MVSRLERDEREGDESEGRKERGVGDARKQNGYEIESLAVW